MAVASRPWILTALSLLNLAAAYTRAVTGLDPLWQPHQPGSKLTAWGIQLTYPSLAVQRTLGALLILSAALLLLSGVGYLRRSRRLGQALGSGLALFNLALSLAMPLLWQARGLGLILAMLPLHPLLTLYVLCRSHRDAFTAP
jgi:hypothetical protein